MFVFDPKRCTITIASIPLVVKRNFCKKCPFFAALDKKRRPLFLLILHLFSKTNRSVFCQPPPLVETKKTNHNRLRTKPHQKIGHAEKEMNKKIYFGEKRNLTLSSFKQTKRRVNIGKNEEKVRNQSFIKYGPHILSWVLM